MLFPLYESPKRGGDSDPRTLREIPDNATFRGKGANTAWLDKLGLFPSLAQRNMANFDYLQFPNYSVLYKMGIYKRKFRLSPFS